LPFDASNDISIYSCPIKTYEYLSFGKPVVSTNIPESKCLEQSGVVYVSNNNIEFLSNIKKALSVSEDLDLIAERKKIAQKNTWEQRWLQIENKIYEYISQNNISISE
jgi:glycosyltransferase involved in cell wall biosynthesis